MGGGSSTPYRTHAEREAERHRREQRAREAYRRKQAEKKRKQEYQAKKNALHRERDKWARSYKTSMLDKQWWNVGWWPVYEWWKVKGAWDEELDRRRREGLVDSDGLPLRAHQN